MKITKTALLIFLATALITSGCALSRHADTSVFSLKMLDAIMGDIKDGLAALDVDMSDTAKKIAGVGLDSPEAKGALLDLCMKHKAYMLDCATVNPSGIMVNVQPPPFAKFAGSNISAHKATIAIEKSREPTFSSVFITTEKIAAIAYEWPIFSDKKEWMGFVSILFKPDLFMKNLSRKADSWSIYDVWVMQRDGRFLYTTDEDQNGRNIFTNPYNKYLTEFVDVGKRIISEETGEGFFHYPGSGQGEEKSKRCMWGTLHTHNTAPRVVLVEKID